MGVSRSQQLFEQSKKQQRDRRRACRRIYGLIDNVRVFEKVRENIKTIQKPLR